MDDLDDELGWQRRGLSRGTSQKVHLSKQDTMKELWSEEMTPEKLAVQTIRISNPFFMSICHIFHERFDSPLSRELFQGLVVCMAGEFAGGMGGYLCRMGCQQSVSELQMPCWQMILWNLHRRMFELFLVAFVKFPSTFFMCPWHGNMASGTAKQVHRSVHLWQLSVPGSPLHPGFACISSDPRWCDAPRPATWVVQQNFQKLVIQQCQQQRFLMFLACSGYNFSITHFSI